MKFSIENKQFKQAVQRMVGMPGGRDATTVMISVDSFEGLVIQRTTAIAEMRLECLCEVVEDGVVTVSYQKLHDLVSSWDDTKVTATLKGPVNGPSLHFKCGTSTASLVTCPACPAFPSVDGDAVGLSSMEFKSWVEVASKAMFTGEGRDELKGVCVRKYNDDLVVVGVDGRRMHFAVGNKIEKPIRQVSETFDSGVLLGKELLSSIDRIIGDESMPMRLQVGENSGRIDINGRVLKFAIPEKTPPDLDFLMRRYPLDISINANRKELISRVRKSTPHGDGAPGMKALSVFIRDKNISIEARDIDGNDFCEMVPCSSTKSEVGFRVNGIYFSDFLEVSNSEIVTFGYVKARQMLTIEDGDRRAILMLINDNKIPEAYRP